ncbi:hypothetical protein B7R54_04625 [Subtercola boreus]|uniref:CMP/dCMP-type deaminase domain-containing protein n=1 Tax=Subtercola boreus TaxID=120213 RepID=A0A3E0VGT8_9MICO|nr:nucleoside deaminase [Subtercola boreus]RFA08590.1 hypothetical protein B7R54_04625 [Subtercola boreus]TQL54472.1 tRNA(Arg) A34 adenosine deaminase TadA [Subtercola boreus]
MTSLPEPSQPDPSITDVDLALLRQAISVSESAVRHGNHPFGALLTDAAGEVVLTAENTVISESDVTAHAETNLVRQASAAFPAAALADFTLYTSCEPCPMCSGAIFWAGIGRVVFALDEVGLYDITGSTGDAPVLMLPCRDVFARGNRAVDVAGPALLEEARRPHLGFWAGLGAGD